MTHMLPPRFPLVVLIFQIALPAFLAEKNINPTVLQNIIREAESVFPRDSIDIHAFKVSTKVKS